MIFRYLTVKFPNASAASCKELLLVTFRPLSFETESFASFWISFNRDLEDVDNGVEENVDVGDGDDTDFSTDEGGVDDLSSEMFCGGDVIDTNVNDGTINEDGFVDSISTGNIINDEGFSDDPAVADTVEKGDVGSNAAAVDTDDNDGFNNLAVDDTIDDWVAGNNPWYLRAWPFPLPGLAEIGSKP